MKGQFIYKIVNTVNGKFYVGSTTNTRERFRTHRNRLRKNRHHSTHLQAAWNKYGEAAFVFHVVEVVPAGTSLQAAEDVWLAEHVGKPHCYNAGLRSGAPWQGAPKEHHPHFGRPKTESERKAISKTLKDFYAEDITNHPRFGKTHSDETKERIRQAKRANPTKVWLGKERSAATKAKISATQKGRANPRKGMPMSEQGRANVAAAVKRGEESHFYGKRPANADDLQKPVYVRKPDGLVETFPSLTYLRDTHGVSIATTVRACKSGKPVQTGVASGWVMSYTPFSEDPVPTEYAHLPRTRQLAKEQGAALYFTGVPCSHGHIAPRKIKGTCVECAKIEGQKSNERTRLKNLAATDLVEVKMSGAHLKPQSVWFVVDDFGNTWRFGCCEQIFWYWEAPTHAQTELYARMGLCEWGTYKDRQTTVVNTPVWRTEHAA